MCIFHLMIESVQMFSICLLQYEVSISVFWLLLLFWDLYGLGECTIDMVLRYRTHGSHTELMYHVIARRNDLMMMIGRINNKNVHNLQYVECNV